MTTATSPGPLTERQPDPGLSFTAAAATLGVSTRTLDRWRQRGQIKVAVLPGGRLRVPRAEVERLLAAR